MKIEMQIQELLFRNGYKGHEILNCTLVDSNDQILMLAHEWAEEHILMNGNGWITAQRCNIEYLLQSIYCCASNPEILYPNSKLSLELDAVLEIQERSEKYRKNVK